MICSQFMKPDIMTEGIMGIDPTDTVNYLPDEELVIGEKT